MPKCKICNDNKFTTTVVDKKYKIEICKDCDKDGSITKQVKEKMEEMKNKE